MKKVRIDPHFAFANMLCDVASARAYGTSRMLFADRPDTDIGEPEPRQSPIMQQLSHLYPDLVDLMTPDSRLTCGDCISFDPNSKRCATRLVGVTADMLACDMLITRSDDDDDGYD